MNARKRPSPRRVEPPSGLDELGIALAALTDTALRVGPEDCPEILSEAAARIRDLEAKLRPHRRPGEQRPFYVRDARVGVHAPTQPRPEIEHRDGLTRGRVRLGVAFEGPHGAVHGGVVALLFDQILGHHNVAIGTRGMTGRLDVRYRQPTPIDAELSFEARTVRTGHRYALVRGDLGHEGVITASAQGLFARASG